MAKKTTADNVTELHPKRMVNLLSDVPAIDRYLKRIGAKAKSPWTAVVEEEHGSYWQDIARVRLDDDGDIHLRRPFRHGSELDPLEPTPEEREEIKKAVADFDWPKLQKREALRWQEKFQRWEALRSPSSLPDAIKDADPEDVFEFFDASGRRVMYQVRVNKKDGGKKYIPWTYWSDGEWRSCEPNELLPLWGAEELRKHSVAFIHEGAKAARWARRIAGEEGAWPLTHKAEDAKRQREQIEALRQHPWAKELGNAAHVGWIGGAPNPDATDWSALGKAQISRAFIVADNDSGGKGAITKISKLLARWDIEVFVIRFTDQFPTGFDLGDEFPAEMFEEREDGSRRYVGPSMRSLLQPATWATAPLPPPKADEKRGPGRPKKAEYYVRPVFRRQWNVVRLETEPLFINTMYRSLRYRERGFNSLVSPFSDVPVAKLMEKSGEEMTVAVAYEPGIKEMVITDPNGRLAVNTWEPSPVRPFEPPPVHAPLGTSPEEYKQLADEQLADLAKPWLDFLTHLFPVENERKEVMRWCATLIARPRIRIRFALLLSSTMQGVGKTTLTDILRKLVGEHNTSIIQELDLKANDNSWMTHKRLAIAPEIYAGHSWAIYQSLKSLISDDVVRVNEKYIPRYHISQWVHFIFCSNSRVPLQMEDTDRRYFMPTVTEERQPKEYWKNFHAWLDDQGYSIIMYWAEEFVRKEGAFGPGDIAPATARKDQLIDDARSRAQHLIRNLGTLMMEQPIRPVPVRREASGKIVAASNQAKPIVVTDEGVLNWLQGQLPSGITLPSLAMIRRELQAVGLSIGKKRIKVGGTLGFPCANFPLPDDAVGSNLTITDPTDVFEF